MRLHFLFILFVFYSNVIYSQNKETDSKKQQKYFVDANNALKEGNELLALYDFNSIQLVNSKTEIARVAKQKIDSLFTLLQKRLTKKWKGAWLMRRFNPSTKVNYQKIVITDSNMFFYNRREDTIVSRAEKIEFARYKPDIFVDIYNVKFSNNEVWRFTIEKESNKLKLFPSIKTESDGTTWIRLDESGLMKVKKSREKAIAEEIRTYYVLEK